MNKQNKSLYTSIGVYLIIALILGFGAAELLKYSKRLCSGSDIYWDKSGECVPATCSVENPRDKDTGNCAPCSLNERMTAAGTCVPECTPPKPVECISNDGTSTTCVAQQSDCVNGFPCAGNSESCQKVYDDLSGNKTCCDTCLAGVDKSRFKAGFLGCCPKGSTWNPNVTASGSQYVIDGKGDCTSCTDISSADCNHACLDPDPGSTVEKICCGNQVRIPKDGETCDGKGGMCTKDARDDGGDCCPVVDGVVQLAKYVDPNKPGTWKKVCCTGASTLVDERCMTKCTYKDVSGKDISCDGDNPTPSKCFNDTTTKPNQSSCVSSSCYSKRRTDTTVTPGPQWDDIGPNKTGVAAMQTANPDDAKATDTAYWVCRGSVAPQLYRRTVISLDTEPESSCSSTDCAKITGMLGKDGGGTWSIDNDGGTGKCILDVTQPKDWLANHTCDAVATTLSGYSSSAVASMCMDDAGEQYTGQLCPENAPVCGDWVNSDTKQIRKCGQGFHLATIGSDGKPVAVTNFKPNDGNAYEAKCIAGAPEGGGVAPYGTLSECLADLPKVVCPAGYVRAGDGQNLNTISEKMGCYREGFWTGSKSSGGHAPNPDPKYEQFGGEWNPGHIMKQDPLEDYTANCQYGPNPMISDYTTSGISGFKTTHSFCTDYDDYITPKGTFYCDTNNKKDQTPNNTAFTWKQCTKEGGCKVQEEYHYQDDKWTTSIGYCANPNMYSDNKPKSFYKPHGNSIHPDFCPTNIGQKPYVGKTIGWKRPYINPCQIEQQPQKSTFYK